VFDYVEYYYQEPSESDIQGAKKVNITEVHSHPMVFCNVWISFKKYPSIKLLKMRQNAQNSGKTVKRIAAIASKTAAEMYGLEILAQKFRR
jgi:prephenate dehydratase